MHHKRKRPKHQRAGCLYCKPHKCNGVQNSFDSLPVPAQRKMQDTVDGLVLEMQEDKEPDYYNAYEGDGMEFERFHWRKAS
jgi:hypothetical protein